MLYILAACVRVPLTRRRPAAILFPTAPLLLVLLSPALTVLSVHYQPVF